MIIRKIGTEDWRAFRDIRLEALRLEPEAFASTYADWADLSPSEWRKRTQTAGVYLAFHGGEPQAIMGLLPQSEPGLAALIMVYVKASHRGGGLARDLLAFALEDAARSGISRVTLHVEPTNAAAIRFYRNAGFDEAGTAPRPDGNLDQPPDLVMTRVLSA